MGLQSATLAQIVDARENCCYDFMFWAKGPSAATTSLTARVEFLNGQGQVLETESISVAGLSLSPVGWTSYRLVTNPAPDRTRQIRVIFAVAGAGANTLWIDDVILAVNGTGPK